MRYLAASSLIFCFTASLFGQTILPTHLRLVADPPPAYGGSDSSLITVNGAAFSTLDGSTARKMVPNMFRFYTDTMAPLVASVSIPSGVVFESWELDLCDFNVNEEIYATVLWINGEGTAFYGANDIVSPPGAPGCVSVSAPSILTVTNNEGGFLIYVFTGFATDGSLSFANARIRYRRQVSPGPTIATFADVPTGHGFFKFVEALYAAGITGGCGGGNYCPDNPVTRGQMAVFLATALGLHWPN